MTLATFCLFWIVTILSFSSIYSQENLTHEAVPPQKALSTPDASAFETTASETSASATTATNQSAMTTSWEIANIQVGISGVYKNGYSTPVTITLSSQAAPSSQGVLPGSNGAATSPLTLELETLDSDGAATLYQMPFDPSGPSSTVQMFVSFGKAKSEFRLRLVSETDLKRTVLHEKTFKPQKTRPTNDADPLFLFPVEGRHPLYFIVGQEDIGLPEAFAELKYKEEQCPVIQKVSHFSDLPTEARGYEAVETLFLTTTEPEFFAGIQAEDLRIRAIADWVRSGGQLVICAGRDSLPLLNSCLRPLLPGTPNPNELKEIRTISEIQTFVPKSKNIMMNGSLDFPFLQIPMLSDLAPDAIVDIHELDWPVLIRRALGFGSVTFLGLDLSTAPICHWNGRSGLLLRLLNQTPPTTTHSAGDSLIKLGYSDLSGQLRSVLDHFDNVRTIPFSLILILMFLYIVVIGPGDWYLTHKILKRPNLTWVTFPSFMILFCLLIVGMGSAMRPNELRVNQVDLIDLDGQTGTIRGTVWSGIYSPQDLQFDLRLVPTNYVPVLSETLSAENSDAAFAKSDGNNSSSSSLSPTRLTWLGLQGSGLGGMDPKAVSPQIKAPPYQICNAEGSLLGIPVPVRSSKSLFGRFWTERAWSPVPPLHALDSVPKGTIVNPLDVPIQNAILFYNRWAIDLGTLPPGETKLTSKHQRLERNRVLNGAFDPFGNTAQSLTTAKFTQYDPQSQEIPYILRAMSFYRLAGGYSSLGLDLTLQHEIDMSSLIDNGRAVLLGTIHNASPTDLSPNSSSKMGQDVSSSPDEPTDSAEILERYGSKLQRLSLPASPRLLGADAKKALAESQDQAMKNEKTPLDRHSLLIRIVYPVQKDSVF